MRNRRESHIYQIDDSLFLPWQGSKALREDQELTKVFKCAHCKFSRNSMSGKEAFQPMSLSDLPSLTGQL